MSATNGKRNPPLAPILEARRLAEDVITPGPWEHVRLRDGSLVLYDRDGEPVVLVYGGLPLARYLEACAPATLFGRSR